MTSIYGHTGGAVHHPNLDIGARRSRTSEGREAPLSGRFATAGALGVARAVEGHMYTNIVQHIVIPVMDEPLKKGLLIVAGAVPTVHERVGELRRGRDRSRGRGRRRGGDRGRYRRWNDGSNLHELASGGRHERGVDPSILAAKNDLPPVTSGVFPRDNVVIAGRGLANYGIVGAWACPHVHRSGNCHGRR